MKHPEPEKIREVADRLMHAASEHPGHVAMNNTSVIHSELCGTVACHAGWYLLARRGKDVIINLDHIPASEFPVETYINGAILLAQDLGFHDQIDLEDWAGDNPKLWGNTEGQVMFYNEEAFGKRNQYGLSVKDIAEHWHTVADRIEEFNKSEEEV